MPRIALSLLAVMALAGPAAGSGAGPIGVHLDAGVPAGVQAGLAWRPLSRLRLEAGVGHNGIATGLRAGAGARLFNFWITPSIALEGGRFFRGDANPAIRVLLRDPTFDEPLLASVGYDFASARLGIEIGSRRVLFYLHAGVGAVWSRLANDPHGLGRWFDDSIELREEPTVRAIGPSARVGTVLYF